MTNVGGVMIVRQRVRGRRVSSAKGITFLLVIAFALTSSTSPSTSTSTSMPMPMPMPSFLVFVSAATTLADNDCNGGSGNKRHSRRHYQVRADSLSNSPCNPLWRENQVYTGERRGPVPISDRDSNESSAMGRTRRRRRTTTSNRNFPGDDVPPSASYIHEIDDVSTSMLGERRQQQQQQQQQPKVDRSTHYNSGGEFPFQSADIGGSSSGRIDIPSQQPQRTIPNSFSKRGRKWSFPIDFSRQNGRLSIGFSFGNENAAPGRRRLLRTTPPPNTIAPPSSPSRRRDSATAPTTTTRNAKQRHRNEIAIANENASVEKAGQGVESGKVSGRLHDNNNIEVSLSLDPFSLASLVRCAAAGGLGAASVYVGTLKLLGPMILAKQCLTRVGYAFCDHYSGRYLRKTLRERVRFLREYEILASARAASRSLVRVLCTGLTGSCVGFLLDRTSGTCVLKPVWLCHWWYGVVWLSSVCATGWACEKWAFDWLAARAGQSSGSGLLPAWWLASVETDARGDDRRRERDRSLPHRYGRRAVIAPPWRFVRRLSRDPEEWLRSLLRVPGGKGSYYGYAFDNRSSQSSVPNKSADDTTIDTLLFPSTWRPLYILTLLAFSKAICSSFCGVASSSPSSDGAVVAGAAVAASASAAASSWKKSRKLILRSFIVQHAFHSEWHRSFVQERRLALGACVSLIGLLTLLWSICAVSAVDRIAAVALIPIAMARLVSGWMNFLLFCNRYNFVDDFVAIVWRHDTAPKQGDVWAL